MAGPLHETSGSWMQKEYIFWAYYGFLILTGFGSIIDALIGISLGFYLMELSTLY